MAFLPLRLFLGGTFVYAGLQKLLDPGFLTQGAPTYIGSQLSALCTHAGCEVAYRDGVLLCPCHGGVFNAQTGAVEGGPPPTPLPARQVVEGDGKVYAARG
jgi:Rieske Fe-S protein